MPRRATALPVPAASSSGIAPCPRTVAAARRCYGPRVRRSFEHLLTVVRSRLAILEDARRRADLADAPLVPGTSLHLPGANASVDDLIDRMGLEPVESETLLVALAAEIDPQIAAQIARLHDDVSQRHPTLGLTLELTATPLTAADARHRLGPDGRLTTTGILLADHHDRPTLARALRLAPRVVDHLLGGQAVDPSVRAHLVQPSIVAVPGTEPLADAILDGSRRCWVVSPPGSAGDSLAVVALGGHPRQPLTIDLAPLGAGSRSESPDGSTGPLAGPWPAVAAHAVVRAAHLEGLLADRPVVVIGVPAAEGDRSGVLLPELPTPEVPLVVVADGPPDPGWGVLPEVVVDAPSPDLPARRDAWERVFVRLGLDGREGSGEVVDDLARAYRLVPSLIDRAATVAEISTPGRRPDVAELRAAVRSIEARRFGRSVTRVDPRVAIDDLVLPPRTLTLLRDVVGNVRHRDLVREEWGIGRLSGRAGISCLLTGPSGTGKTLSAEAVAGELGVDMYTIDLSQVIDKYVGETEKNLERIFASAEGANAVLFFDEADALFGKRTDVRDAHDRYANVEVAYLLQRIEAFDGVSMLATNLPGNVDEAFARRFDVILRFTLPDAVDRARLWHRHLPDTLPLGADLDIEFLARALDVPGGVIANICRTAAFMAAARSGSGSGPAVGMADLVRAAARELDKQGRLRNDDVFGPWAAALTDT